MSVIQVASAAVINAAAEKIYTILADYRQHHPHILPKKYFPGIEVEAGGFGAGTIFRVHTQALGRRQTFHMQVTEPEPGRLLVETDLTTGLVTTFTVVPQGSQQTEVTIATTWESQAGLQGWLERRLAPLLMRRIYQQELQQLEAYAGGKP